MKTKDRKIKNEIVPLSFELNSIRYEGEATPLSSSCMENVCFELNIHLNKEQLGTFIAETICAGQ